MSTANQIGLTLAPGLDLAPTVPEKAFLVRGVCPDAGEQAEWRGLQVDSLRRFVALCLTSHFVTSPFFGTELRALPPRGQFLLWETTGGRYGVLLPVLDGDYRTEAFGSDDGLGLRCECGPMGRRAASVTLAVVAQAADPFEAVQSAVIAAVEWMRRGRLRVEKQAPRWMDRLGWCTWDAFYTEVDESKILEGLRAFRESGVVPGHVIIDEGWQDASPTKYLRSFGVKPGAFTTDRLRTVVDVAKREFGVAQVGCWRTLFGQLRGVDPESPGLAEFQRRLVHEPGTESDTFGVVEPHDVRRFHDTYAARLAADGVDFLKVDFQSALHLMTYGQVGRAGAARLWQEALQESVERHFGGELLNCMAMGSDEVYHAQIGNVVRSSDDYYPTQDASHPRHIRQNLYNALWLAPMQWCDWDMFQSGHPWAEYHAVGRAISGGPVYVSDKPGQSDPALLQRFLAADGKLLRCSQPALPTRDLLFADPVAGGRLLKAWNRAGETGLIAAFHPGTDPAGVPIEETITPAEIEGFDAALCAVWSARRGYLGIWPRDRPLTVRLAVREAELLVFCPLIDGFAPIGLVDKWNPAPAIRSVEHTRSGWTVETRGGGRWGFYAKSKVSAVRIDDRPVPFEVADGFHRCDTLDSPRCRLEICFDS